MAVRIALAGVDELSRIEPLTRALHDHHRTVDPAIPGVPLRETDAWWSVRRERYRAWLAEPDTFLLVADDDGAVQTTVQAQPFPSGATGLHQIPVTVS